MMAVQRFNQLSILMLICILVLALTLWSVIAQPTATLIVTLPLNDRYEHQLDDAEEATAWWHMQLLADISNVSAGVILSAEGEQGQGHHLHWDPRNLYWRLTRSGSGPHLLAQGQLTNIPRRLSLYRFGYRLEVQADGETIAQSFDFADAPPAQTWRLQLEHEGPQHRMEVHNHVYLASATINDDDHYQQFQDILRSYAGLQHNDLLLYQQASTHIAYFTEPHHSQSHLWSWLMWAYGSSLIARGPQIDSGGLAAVIDYLRVAGAGSQVISEIPGMLYDLQRATIRQASKIPETPIPAQEFISRRRSWLHAGIRIQDAIDELTAHASARERAHIMSEQDRFLALMNRQVSQFLSSSSTAAMPAEAPSWVTNRTRALTGRLPIEIPLPEIVRDWFPRPWLRPSTEGLLALAGGMGNQQGLLLRAQILSGLRDEPHPDFAQLIEASAVDARSRIITAAILSVYGAIDADIGYAGLTRQDADGISLMERDPLAYALYRLLFMRQAEAMAQRERSSSWSLPPGLTPYRQLLDGGFGATIIAFSRPGDTMPPPEALAAALAMQEVSGIRPQWELLRALPSINLPLSLLIPPPPPVDPILPHSVPQR
ncbi:MAG: hypothetical protein EA402_06565 [Planctomycetota bacterium]|nr:MAG: hypothetical protein EA402_06565 [Planctomycetota bacterium]